MDSHEKLVGERRSLQLAMAALRLRVAQIEEHIRSPKVLSQFGRLLLADKRYEQANAAFERAKNFDAQIGVLLKHLGRADDAIRLARESRSSEGARQIAK